MYELEEPFRWLADVSVIQAFESGVLDLPDFNFTGDDYRYRFEPEAKHRFIGILRERFNSGVHYNGRVLKWDTIIEQKAIELGRFLTGKSAIPDFSDPAPILERHDDVELRTKILGLAHSKAKELGIGKNTLHYLRKRAQASHSLYVYRKIRDRLSNMD